MKSSILVISILLFLNACTEKVDDRSIQPGNKQKPSSPEAFATFAQGCFWHTEIVFQSLEGVRDAVSGYAGGTTVNPSYEAVATGRTGHAESVQVFYDPEIVSFQTLVNAFFASHDPTLLNRQGPDVGTEYRSVAFYNNPAEKKIIEAEMKRITEVKTYSRKIVTEVVPLAAFYPAEDYHQEYIYHHPQNPYVRTVSLPDFERFRKSFKGNLKKQGEI